MFKKILFTLVLASGFLIAAPKACQSCDSNKTMAESNNTMGKKCSNPDCKCPDCKCGDKCTCGKKKSKKGKGCEANSSCAKGKACDGTGKGKKAKNSDMNKTSN